ncbi:5-guanidino-2-oxopentanoate decarboxylase [Acidimangrovimonas sediminis]|uniref:5-guanidino-2-oxopentanoate decarboxylase n=1 Tax=Acidimangrovimonas sediminis TaxID=2056283 RepID=UPI000C807B12|nr:5-guanidino-2-oxopentanoate decarboxylase [Acidimangrovimonas sediminis]
MQTVGAALVAGLEARGVSVVFGIPGVHTVELYRALPGSGLRHVTVRHEQAAGFAADGYARVSGRPGLAFVITGPGATNMLTPMAQARADSVPMLVVSGVNPRAVQGRGLGHLHELPDQLATMASVALHAEEIASGETVGPALDRAFAAMAGRGGPAHLQVPLDVMPAPAAALPAPVPPVEPPLPDLSAARERLAAARRPVILAGGGAKRAGSALTALAEALDAPVVMTANARGVMHGHPLGVPASPSLTAVRALIADADQVLAVGTEFGPTDYDMYVRGGLPDLSGMIRIDADADQLGRHPAAVALKGDAGRLLAALLDSVVARESGVEGGGAARAGAARAAAWEEIGEGYRAMVAMLDALRGALPGAIVVGDSTQPVYAGNLYYDHDRPCGWFNAATGYGALGYGAPAAIGAALAAPEAPVVCLTGDGGLQFSLAELMTARDEGVDVTFLVWNNGGYREIAEAMEGAGVEVLGCDPTPPGFADLARACGLPYERIAPDPEALGDVLVRSRAIRGPKLVEVAVG